MELPSLLEQYIERLSEYRAHFSKTNKETMSGKIKRMLKNEIWQM